MVFGQRAKLHLSDLMFGSTVTLEGDKGVRYGRSVAKVIRQGRDINFAQVEAGMAWHYKRYEREQSAEDREIYAASEQDARQARRGLWQESQPMAPWEWHADRSGRL